jgi:hypothetical protein
MSDDTRHFRAEDPYHPRGRVRATLQLLQERERGEREEQVCSNERCEELCYAVIEATYIIAQLQQRIATLEDASAERDDAIKTRNEVDDHCFKLMAERDALRAKLEELTVERGGEREMIMPICFHCGNARVYLSTHTPGDCICHAGKNPPHTRCPYCDDWLQLSRMKAERDRAVAECDAWREAEDLLDGHGHPQAYGEARDRARRLRAENEREGR